ncbi:MAG: DUF4160 domain-containing protein [Planctomycetes bacterium]|nr:DUF4160 domain-containing protein [Planctomycetota bacterium]
MPIISRFLGITIYLNYSDRAPPHFHVRYAGSEATVSIDPPGVMRGHLPPRVTGIVVEWATARRADLLQDWALARTHQPLRAIDPLE